MKDMFTNNGSGMPSWGVRINTSRREPRPQDPRPEGCPAWAKPWDWLHYGVVVWEEALQRVEVVSFGEAVTFLDRFRSTDTWKSEGVVITRTVSYQKHPEKLSAPPSRKKRAQPVSDTPQEKPEWITIDEERIRLRDQAAIDFYAFLEANEARLRRMADEVERQKQEALSRVWALIFRWSHERDAKELDVASRPFPWTYDEKTVTWTCDMPPNRGTVALTKDNWFWQGCIEQPDRFKHESPWFMELEKALAWAEQELLEIQQEAEAAAKVIPEPPVPRLTFATITRKQRAKLRPYWIKPSDLEPERRTYQVFIELDYAPHSFKTWDISFECDQNPWGHVTTAWE